MSADGDQVHWSLTLYVNGASPRSAAAVDTVRRICDEQLTGRVELRVLDVRDHPEMARTDGVVAVPALVRRLPSPPDQLVGNLADAGRLRAWLDPGLGAHPALNDERRGGSNG